MVFTDSFEQEHDVTMAWVAVRIHQVDMGCWAVRPASQLLLQTTPLHAFSYSLEQSPLQASQTSSPS